MLVKVYRQCLERRFQIGNVTMKLPFTYFCDDLLKDLQVEASKTAGLMLEMEQKKRENFT